jgi:hypothetical protein
MHKTKATCKHGLPWFEPCLGCREELWDSTHDPLQVTRADIIFGVNCVSKPRPHVPESLLRSIAE